MSQDHENKPDEPVFDMSFLGLGGDGDSPPTDDGFNPFPDQQAAPGQPEGFGMQFPPFDGGEQAAPADPSSVFREEGVPASEDFPGPLGDLPSPSGFLTGDAEQAETTEDADSPFPGTTFPDASEDEPEDGKKKGKAGKKAKKEKKPKKEKEKKPSVPKGPLKIDGVLSLMFGVLLLIGLIAANVLIVLSRPENIGATSMIYYLVGLNVFGLCGVAVPFMFYANRDRSVPADDTEEETAPVKEDPNERLDFFKVGLGVSAMLLSLTMIFLLTVCYSYDFQIKPAGSPAAAPPPAAEAPPAEETPAPTP